MSGHNCKAQGCPRKYSKFLTVGQLLTQLRRFPKALPIYISRHSTDGYDDGGFIVEVCRRETLGLGAHVNILADASPLEGLD